MSRNLYCEMAIEVFKRMHGALPFDVYVKLGEDRFTKIFNKGDAPDLTRFNTYEKKGAKILFIHKKDRRTYINSTEKLIRKMLNQDKLSLAEASFAIEEMTEQIMFEIFEDGIFDDESLFKSQALSKTYVRLLQNDVNVLTAFLKMSKNETYMVRHSISTSIIGLLIAKADSNNNERILEIVCLGGLLHDIGMCQLPSDLNETDRKLTEDEWAKVKQHPFLGVRIISQVDSFPTEVREVILQHHENYNGTGYPRCLRGEAIYYPARIIAIADAFSALTTRRGGRPLFTPFQAMNILLQEKGKFDPKILKSFENLLMPGKKKAA